MRRGSPHVGAGGFTITEVLVAGAVSAVMFAALLYTAVSFNRVFAATEDFSQATSEQQRAIDFVSRDLRRAYTVTVSPDGKKLTLTMPDTYTAYDTNGNPTDGSSQPNRGTVTATKYPAGLPVNPTITDGVVDYGDPKKPITVSYYISGQTLIRDQTVAATGKTSSLAVCNYAADFQSTFSDSTSIVSFSINFAPNFQARAGRETQSRSFTTLTATTAVRNLRR